ncbi:outer membrane lipoprotein-sorting protein [bacterium]|nr:outer membrane lipoprotein-sorting protein [candidate division CSSED10-310 bacterium]
MKTISGFITLMILMQAPVFAQETIPEGNEILMEIDRNLTPESFESYRKIINIEPDGTSKEFVLYAIKKGNDKMVTTFLSPKTEEGRSTLRLGENMWLFIPSVGKPVRITSLQSVIGGIFNNSDIMQLDYSAEYNVIEMEEEEGQTRLVLKAKTGAVAYDKLIMWIDKEHVTPTKVECRTASGMLIKTLYFKEIKDFSDGIVRPAVTETDSPLHQNYKSIMLFAKMEKRDVDDEIFTINNMHKIKDLRK